MQSIEVQASSIPFTSFEVHYSQYRHPLILRVTHSTPPPHLETTTMGHLTGQGDLAAVSLAFFIPAIAIALYINLKHGLAKRLGWFYIILLSIFRIIGAVCVLWMETQNDRSTALIVTAAITNAAGTAPLLLALLGFLERVNSGLNDNGVKGLPQKAVFRPIHLIALAGLILAIVGGIELNSANTAHDSKAMTGHHLMQAGSILFSVLLLCIAVINGLYFHRRAYVIPAELKLVYAGLAALPFLIVRIAYTVIVAFSTSTSSSFYYRHISVWADAFMRFLPEAMVVIFFIVAGLLTPKADALERTAAHEYGSKQAEIEEGSQSRSLGDYRPSRLIRDAYRHHQASKAAEEV